MKDHRLMHGGVTTHVEGFIVSKGLHFHLQP